MAVIMLLRYTYYNIPNRAFGKGVDGGIYCLVGSQELISQIMSHLAEQRIVCVFDTVCFFCRWWTGGAG